MCALGHHEHQESIRPSRARRHSDGSVERAVRHTARKELQARKQTKTFQLIAELSGHAGPEDGAVIPPGLFDPVDVSREEANGFEPVRRDEQQLSDDDIGSGREPQFYWQKERD